MQPRESDKRIQLTMQTEGQEKSWPSLSTEYVCGCSEEIVVTQSHLTEGFPIDFFTHLREGLLQQLGYLWKEGVRNTLHLNNLRVCEVYLFFVPAGFLAGIAVSSSLVL